MKKIFLLLILLNSFAFSIVDESKIDIYFGNGILTEEGDAEDNAKLLEENIKQKYGLKYYHKHIGKVDYAYNQTRGMALDLFESTYQVINLQDLEDKLYKFGSVATLKSPKKHNNYTNFHTFYDKYFLLFFSIYFLTFINRMSNNK